ncbi:MAG: hypothetical protein AB7K24_28275 [Gemmataceae bacterium]
MRAAMIGVVSLSLLAALGFSFWPEAERPGSDHHWIEKDAAPEKSGPAGTGETLVDVGGPDIGGTILVDDGEIGGQLPHIPDTPEKLLANAKPKSEQVEKALAYLANQQHKDGGWGQGGGWRTGGQQGGRVEGPNVEDPSDVGNTCIAALAFLRAGNTPTKGKYAEHLARAVDFICKNVENADAESLHVTPVRNTQLQSKIGPYIDTFLAAQVLAELKDQAPSPEKEKRLLAALSKTIDKMAKHQQQDGTWSREGWAAVFSQGVAIKSLNQAALKNVPVPKQVLVRAENWAQAQAKLQQSGAAAPGARLGVAGGYGGGFGGMSAPASADAGIALYSASNIAAGLQQAGQSNSGKKERIKAAIARADTPEPDREEAKQDLARIEATEQVYDAQRALLVDQVSNPQFVRGFGSNGGEEFLSYLNISEVLHEKGGKPWEKWDRHVAALLSHAQDRDGSYSGHHCITGKTFCTSAAVLVLLADQAPKVATAKPEPKK